MGRQEGLVELVLRQLNRRLGRVSPRQQQAIRKLPIARIEDLGEALLDFRTPADLRTRLNSHFQVICNSRFPQISGAVIT